MDLLSFLISETTKRHRIRVLVLTNDEGVDFLTLFGEKQALEHNFVLMGEGIQESYIDIKLSPLYIGNDKGITFSMPTSWTNPDRDKLIVSKAEVYVNGALSRSVTMSDGRPGEEPSSRIFSLDMDMKKLRFFQNTISPILLMKKNLLMICLR